jgi:hypothetical protein
VSPGSWDRSIKDDHTSIKPCQDIADAFSKAGGQISVRVYADSTHGFDGNPANTGMINLRFIENYTDCIAYVEEDGQLIYAAKRWKAASRHRHA